MPVYLTTDLFHLSFNLFWIFTLFFSCSFATWIAQKENRVQKLWPCPKHDIDTWLRWEEPDIFWHSLLLSRHHNVLLEGFGICYKVHSNSRCLWQYRLTYLLVPGAHGMRTWFYFLGGGVVKLSQIFLKIHPLSVIQIRVFISFAVLKTESASVLFVCTEFRLRVVDRFISY